LDLPASQPKILVVDDEPINVDVLGGVLASLGDIITADNGQAAIDICKSNKPDIVLLDVMMPQMDGYEVCAKLKGDEDTNDIPIIFVTALSDDTDEARGIEMGAIDYLTKPVNATVAIARVRNHLELKKYRDYLAEIAFIDGLTGIPNRRRFEEHFASEWQRARRTEAEMSLILMDIDQFKLYNDTYGHHSGDACLTLVGQALTKSAHRPGDMIARYGGEEFVAVLPDTGKDGAIRMAETIRENMAALKIAHEPSGVSDYVTLSMGLVTWKISRGKDPKAMIEVADKALYDAKENGRDCYQVSPMDY
jgi:diguanylate cyclase (GGDEF)-like protein